MEKTNTLSKGRSDFRKTHKRIVTSNEQMKKKKGLDSLKIKEIQMQNTIFTYKLSEKRFQVMKIALELQKEYSGIVDRDVNWFKHSEVYFVTLYKKESLKNMQSF